MQPRSILISIATIALVSAAVPAGVADTTLVDLALGSAHSADFNDDPTYASSPVPPPPPRPAPNSDWAWGVPTSGPGVAASGSNVWATNLSGLYRASHCGAIMSPPIDLTAATTASVSFAEWHHFELSSLTGTAWDAGALYVSADGGMTLTQVTPASGHGTQTIGTTSRACLDGMLSTGRGFTGPVGTTLPAPAYATRTADLSAFAGQTVQFLIAFGSDGSGHRTGWYIDDFAVTIDGVTTLQDFEASDGGFTVVGTKVPPVGQFGWGHGVPTTGPGNVTDALWGTNLNGLYGLSECAWIESAPFTVGPLPSETSGPVQASLSWQQWFRGSSGSTAGVVQIGDGTSYTIVKPAQGYGNPTGAGLDACTGHVAAGTGAFTGLIDTLGSPMVDYTADITDFVGKTVTVRFLFASTATATRYEGWYVDNVNVDVKLFAAAPDAEDLVSPSGDAPGWSHGGVASSWGYGVAVVNGTNETVYNTNLAGNYNPNECSYVDSPAVPGMLASANPTLKFDQWYRMESAFSSTTYDGSVVMMSVDGGSTWTLVALPEYDRPMFSSALKACMADHGVAATQNVFSGQIAGWETVSASLGAIDPGASVKVRFLFGSDGSVQYDGWSIKNVEIAGVKVL